MAGPQLRLSRLRPQLRFRLLSGPAEDTRSRASPPPPLRLPRTELSRSVARPPAPSRRCPVRVGLPGPGCSGDVAGRSFPAPARAPTAASRPQGRRRSPAGAIPLGYLQERGAGRRLLGAGRDVRGGAGRDGAGGWWRTGSGDSAGQDLSSARCSHWLTGAHGMCVTGSHRSLGRAGE